MLGPQFVIPSSPLAHAEAVVKGDRWRITVIASGLLRLEWADDGVFEDRASTFALHRDLPVPTYEVTDGPRTLELATDRLRLSYDRGPFSPAGLSLQVRGNISSYHSVWRYGEVVDDLGGTARTLDNADGRVPLGPGVVSRWGFAQIDDSRSLVFHPDGWFSARDGTKTDLYVFAYGHDYPEALRALYALSGPQPLLPRWALGNWWSRYHRYSAAEYLALLDRFEAEHLPFSVAVLDMDWHRVDDFDPAYGSGWTGYSWNPDLFPDPQGFLSELHRRGLRTTLNVHPADGVRAFEDAYEAMAEALGADTSAGQAIAFDVTDPAFMQAYFSVLHRPLEDQGVDFWWIDWQSGPYSRQAGVDPLWALNHYHFLDSGREGRRPLTFSRYAGPGSHRYPVGFSGDSAITWRSLAFQPEFTATASNIGYGWWSHDIGGHWKGARDDELAARWAQLGAFSPIMRLHSSNSPFMRKEPWAYGPGAAEVIADAVRFRHRLIPYLHTMNHRAASTATPLVLPMYYRAPEADIAYTVPNQYTFGSELLVAPITTPKDPVTTRGSVRVWLPQGTWADIFTGVVYEGDQELVMHRGPASLPVLLRAGGMLPLVAEPAPSSTDNPRHLELVVMVGRDGQFELVEDDGTGSTLESVPTVRTPLSWDQAAGALTIGPASGPEHISPELRTWTVTFLGLRPAGAVHVDGSPVETSTGPGRTSLTVADEPIRSRLTIAVGPNPVPRTDDLPGRLFELLDQAQYGLEAKAMAWRTLTDGPGTDGPGTDGPGTDGPGTGRRRAASQIACLLAQGTPVPLLSAITELLIARR